MNDCSHCSAAFILTAQGEHPALAETLLTEARNLLEVSAGSEATATLFMIKERGSHHNNEPENGMFVIDVSNKDKEDLPIESVPGLQESFNTKGQITLPLLPGKTRFVLPISSEKSVEEFLVIDMATDDILNHLVYLSHIYQNCRKLIIEKDCDGLTSLLSRKTFNTQLSKVLAAPADNRRQKEQRHNWLAFLDLDFFKRINDTYGHLYGDEVLLTTASLMKKCFRSDDMLFRYGGEEFCVLFHADTLEQATMILERYRTTVETHRFLKDVNITISAGFNPLKHGEIPSEAVDQVDKALYYAKENGRNQIRCYDTLVSKGHLDVEKAYRMNVEIFE
ncbi:MAG: GGDEF domain-containing protein [Mariprofundaceae bacterium]